MGIARCSPSRRGSRHDERMDQCRDTGLDRVRALRTHRQARRADSDSRGTSIRRRGERLHELRALPGTRDDVSAARARAAALKAQSRSRRSKPWRSRCPRVPASASTSFTAPTGSRPSESLRAVLSQFDAAALARTSLNTGIDRRRAHRVASSRLAAVGRTITEWRLRRRFALVTRVI